MSTETVYVEDASQPLSYHRSRHLGTTIDMDELPREEAERRGAVPCSKCFNEQDAVQYPFNYFGMTA
jgi:hypothetical protein